MNKKMINITAVIAKIFEILLWLGDALMIVACIVTMAAGNFVENMLKSGIDDGTLTVTGFDINVISADGSFNTLAILFAFIAGIVGMGFGAMICRNINQIFKAEQPFCTDNIRRVREIGIFAIAIPVTQIVLSILIELIGANTIEVSVDASTIFFGLVVLCLSQFFHYGANLEKDVDGLV